MSMSRSEQRAERIERQVVREIYVAAGAAEREQLGLELHEVDGATVLLARNDPNILLNRVVGLGVEQPARPGAVAAIRALFAERGIDEYFLHLHHAAQPASLHAEMGRQGLVASRGWVPFVRGASPVRASHTSLEVRRIGPEHAADFGRIAAECFELSEPAARVVANQIGRPGWFHFMSFSGDAPAGTGALFVEGDTAWLDWGATDAEYRCRGGQRAVLCHRIDFATRLGCRLLLSETGEAVPGDPQHSYRNLEWAGFRPGVVRDNFVPAPVTQQAV